MKRILQWLLPIAVLLTVVFAFSPTHQISGWKAPEHLSKAAGRQIQDQLWEIAEFCGGFPESGVFERKNIDQLEEMLIAAGYAVVDSDEIYPDYLANSDGLREFWEERRSGRDSNQTVLSVQSDGIWYSYFAYTQGEDWYYTTQLTWDSEGKSYVRESVSLPVYDMDLTQWDIFYYRVYPSDVHYIDYGKFRLTPVDHTLYDLNRKYILPVGYQFTNLFLCDWQEGAWGALSLTDQLEYLYQDRTGEFFLWDSYPAVGYPLRILIPAEVFETTIFSYFNLSLEELRQLCQYDPTENGYLWRPMYGEDITPWKYPFCEPEVVDVKENADHTLTLTVQVFSSEVKTDRLFIHELTVRPQENGGFQYVSNRVTYVGPWGMPPAMARFQLDVGT